jgi:hypothetical protein
MINRKVVFRKLPLGEGLAMKEQPITSIVGTVGLQEYLDGADFS